MVQYARWKIVKMFTFKIYSFKFQFSVFVVSSISTFNKYSILIFLKKNSKLWRNSKLFLTWKNNKIQGHLCYTCEKIKSKISLFKKGGKISWSLHIWNNITSCKGLLLNKSFKDRKGFNTRDFKTWLVIYD